MIFAFGKAFKYLSWGCLALFFYHMYLIKKTKEPSQGFLANQFFLDAAKTVDFFIYDLKLMLTRPPVAKLLPDRPQFPGVVYPKLLVLNLRGTLIHSEYKVSF